MLLCPKWANRYKRQNSPLGKKVGDRIERDEVLLEISTDKVDTEVPSPASGVLVEQLAAEGILLRLEKSLHG